MNHFIKTGNTFRVFDGEAIDIRPKLPVGTYSVMYSDDSGFYLETMADYRNVGRIYGDHLKDAERILNSFEDRPGTTGVLLSGEKGSGKTLLARLISELAHAKGYPTLLINQPFMGDTFNKLIMNVGPAILIFDEFEKVYSSGASELIRIAGRENNPSPSQESILTLLDGMFPSKKLFIFTANDIFKVDKHVKNRPGRILYSLDFEGLEQTFIREYCVDNLKNQEYVENVCRVASVFNAFNFDMLKAIVEEMNRYNESPQQVLKYLNAKPHYEFGGSCIYDIAMTVKGEKVATNDDTTSRNPIIQDVEVYWRTKPNQQWEMCEITPADIVEYRVDEQLIVAKKDDRSVTFKRKAPTKLDIWKAL